MRAGARRCTKWRADAACRCAGTGRLLQACGWVVLFGAAVASVYMRRSVHRHQGFCLAWSFCAVQAGLLCASPHTAVFVSCCLTLNRCHLIPPAHQDFMGFLHLGWESATFEDDGLCKPLAELSPLWAAVAQVGCWDGSQQLLLLSHRTCWHSGSRAYQGMC